MSGVRAVLVPTVYRMIASGDVVPVFDPPHAPIWLILGEDGHVTWADKHPDEPEEFG